MSKRWRLGAAWFGGMLALAVVGLAAACTAAKAETFEVTYYYLPG